MRSICLFASYFTSHELPYYIKVYLTELKKHFQDVILLTSQVDLSAESLDFLRDKDIPVNTSANEGFDFGLWSRAFQKVDLEKYDQVALVNDSCILFKPLTEFINWTKTHKADFLGMTMSESIAPHLQSYFLVVNKKAIGFVNDYFANHGVLKTIGEVIRVYEIGMSQHLLSNGLKMAAYIDNNGYRGEFSPYYHCIKYHLEKGIPLIKKKILFSSYRRHELFTLARMNFNIDPEYYIKLIKQYNNIIIIDFNKLRADINTKMSFIVKLKFFINYNLVAFKRKFIDRQS